MKTLSTDPRDLIRYIVLLGSWQGDHFLSLPELFSRYSFLKYDSKSISMPYKYKNISNLEFNLYGSFQDYNLYYVNVLLAP